MGTYGHLFAATFPAHTFSAFSHFCLQSLFYFSTAMFLIVQQGSPMISEWCPPFLFFLSGGGEFDVGIPYVLIWIRYP